MSESNSNKQWKRVPFDIELAKKIQSKEVEGRIVTQDNEPVRIVCFDKKSTNKREMYQVVALVEINGCECLIICGENGLCWDCEKDCNRSLHIELPEEAPKHEFKPFDKVLVRDFPTNRWFINLFSHYGRLDNKVTHHCMCGNDWIYCIPYEGNGHLIGTTDNPK